MIDFLKKVRDKYTKCDSGKTLNVFIHPFLFMLLGLSVGFLFFGDTTSINAVVLYTETSREVGSMFINVWALLGLLAIILHTVAFWVRGEVGIQLLRITLFLGFFLWLWAAIIYLQGLYFIQLLVFCFPQLYFWVWYALEWTKRRRGEETAFV